MITSGIPRKPGMTREELIGTNANIMKNVVDNVIKYSPRAIFVIVANPMDALTYLAFKHAGVPPQPRDRHGRRAGFGPLHKCYLSLAAKVNINDVDGMVIGGHGDTFMIPLTSKATIKGVPASQFPPRRRSWLEVAASTMVGGATLTKLIGTSAWYAPVRLPPSWWSPSSGDQKKMIPCSCYLEGEYGEKAVSASACRPSIGRKGIEKIVRDRTLGRGEGEVRRFGCRRREEGEQRAARNQRDLIIVLDDRFSIFRRTPFGVSDFCRLGSEGRNCVDCGEPGLRLKV